MDGKVENQGDNNFQNKNSPINKIVFFGLICIALYFALGVTSITLSSISFKTIYATWSEGPWYALGPTSVSASVVCVFTSFLGVLAYLQQNKSMFHLYFLFLLLSLLFSWSLSLFALIEGTVWYKVKGKLGCDTKQTGIMQMYNNMDTYMKYADSLLCSSQCKCPFAQATIEEYVNNEYAKDTFSMYEYYNNTELDSFPLSYLKEGINKRHEFNIKYCSEYVKHELEDRYRENSNSTHHWILTDKFAKYWKRIEKKFNCTGWCRTKYEDPYTYETKSMFKFIFSDINLGIPKYPGCLNRILIWVPKMLLAYGGCMIFAAFIQTLSFLISLQIFKLLPPGKEEFSSSELHR